MTDRAIAWPWIKANIIAAIIAAAAALAVYGMRQALGAADAKAGLATILVHCVFAAGLFGISGAAWGVLTGAVLQRIIPRLPAWNWVVLHVALSIAVGVSGELGASILPDGATDQALQSGGAQQDLSIQAKIAAGLVVGMLVGTLVGGLEATVLGQAADGAGAWILWSAASFATVMVLLFVSDGVRDPDAGWSGELSSQVFSFIGAAIVAVMLLPALMGLRPRAIR